MDLIDRLREAAQTAFAGQPVAFAYLFGSHARGRAAAESDVDVAIFLDHSISAGGHQDLALRLAGELERVAGIGPIDTLVVLNDAPLPLAGRVIHEGRAIYSRDEVARVRYESRTFREFVDFDLFARRLDQELLEAHARGER